MVYDLVLIIDDEYASPPPCAKKRHSRNDDSVFLSARVSNPSARWMIFGTLLAFTLSNCFIFMRRIVINYVLPVGVTLTIQYSLEPYLAQELTIYLGNILVFCCKNV